MASFGIDAVMLRPDVTLVIVNLVKPQESEKLFLKRNVSMVLFLIGDVGVAHGCAP